MLGLSWDEFGFVLPSVEYLGHTISAEGLYPTLEKVRAITAVPTLKDVP